MAKEVLDLQVAASLDDAASIAIACVSDMSFNGAGFGSVAVLAGMRFTPVAIPPGSTINKATMTHIALLKIGAGTVLTRLYGEDVDDAPDYDPCGLIDREFSNKTVAFTDWDVSSWAAESTQVSPDIAAVIQEIIGRPGWALGNALMVFWVDDGSASFHLIESYSYDNDPAKAPKLHIEFTVPDKKGRNGKASAKSKPLKHAHGRERIPPEE